MTTETRSAPRRTSGARVLAGAAGVALALGAVLVLAGALVAGRPAALGALVGTVLVVGVIAFGAFSVNEVARVMPGASLVAALVTYGAQLTTTLVALVLLQRSGLLDDGTLDRGWLGAAVIVTVLAWTAGQVVALRRARIPVYDLPEAGAR